MCHCVPDIVSFLLYHSMTENLNSSEGKILSKANINIGTVCRKPECLESKNVIL